MRRRHNKNNNNRLGFTLIEVGMVLVIMGFMFAAGTALVKSYLMSTRLKVTRDRMVIINQAITQFVRLNGRLPCIADLSTPMDYSPTASTSGFGTEIYMTAAPVSTSMNTCASFFAAHSSLANRYYVRNSNNPGVAATPAIAIGAVPTRTLDIPDEYMVDGWGNRFTYVVTIALASPPPTTGAFPLDFTQGGITIKDASGNDYTTPPSSATYLLISHGADSLGAFAGYPATLGGAGPAKACPAAAVTESANCAYVTDGATTETFKTTLKTGAGFDDVVSVGTVNTGAMAASVQVVPDIASPPTATNTYTNSSNPGSPLSTATAGPPYIRDCQQGYVAVACSGEGTGGKLCQGTPCNNCDTPSAANSITYSACMYGTTGNCDKNQAYYFFTTCVRY
jgi:type II secretory pathway pseudopilin PulG